MIKFLPRGALPCDEYGFFKEGTPWAVYREKGRYECRLVGRELEVRDRETGETKIVRPPPNASDASDTASDASDTASDASDTASDAASDASWEEERDA